MNDKDKMRIGDSDRELVSRLLKSAVDEGKLSLSEYDERLQQVYEAKTVGDLTPVTGDLIARGGVLAVTEKGGLATAESTAAGTRRRPRSTGTPVWVKWMWFGWAVPVAVCLVIWAILVLTGSGSQGLWPLWVAGPPGAVLLCVTGMEYFLIRPALLERDGDRIHSGE